MHPPMMIKINPMNCSSLYLRLNKKSWSKPVEIIERICTNNRIPMLKYFKRIVSQKIKTLRKEEGIKISSKDRFNYY